MNPTNLREYTTKVRFDVRPEHDHAHGAEYEVVEVPEQHHGSEQAIVVELVQDVIRVVLSQLE